VEIRLLGVMEVLDDSGTPVVLKGTKLRCLLAVLALRPGQVVSSDRLVEDLWGESPPPNSANALQALVSRLRRALPGDAVATQAHGYSLALEQACVDAVRFGEMAVAGRRALADGDAGTALSVLGEALALWRGDALADFAFEQFAQMSIGRLTEERASVFEDRVEADLRCGRHAEIVGELEAAVSADPLRERLRGQLMVALYRAGRQADALRQFQLARTVLAEELGLEPGPELRRLEAAVLAQDPDLALTVAEQEPPPAHPRPRRGNVRPPITATIGRDAEIAELRQLLSAHRLVTLVGPGGVGKTRLAIETARVVDEDVADGAWFIDLSRTDDPEAVVPTIVSALEATDLPGYGAGSAEALERLADSLACKGALVVLDNCEHVIEAAALAAESLLGACPRLRILATSREALQVPGEKLWQSQPLAPSAAMALFAERAAAVSSEFTLGQQNSSLVAEICARVDGLPLAVELAAARVKVFPVAQIAAGLEDKFRFLSGGSRTAHARQQSLQAVVDWSYDLLFADERRLFERLSVFVGGCTVEAAIAVCADDSLPAEDVPDLVAKLVGKSVVVVDTTGTEARFAMLQTLAEYAGERLDTAGERSILRDRHSKWFTELADGYHQAFQGQGAASWMRRASPELDNMRSALNWAAVRTDALSALTLATAIAWCSVVRGSISDSMRLLEIALGLAEHPSTAKARCHALAWRSLLSIQAEQPDPGPGAEAVIRLAKETGDRELEAWMSLMFAEICAGRGDVERARELLTSARSFYAGHGGDVDQAIVALIDGSLAHVADDIDAAERHFSVCRRLSAAGGLPHMELTCLMMLSNFAESRGELSKAESLLAEVMKGEVELGQRGREVGSLARMASLAARRGEHERAAALYDQAERVADATLSEPGLAQALRIVALRLRRTGDDEPAVDAARRALAIYERGVVLPGIVDCLALLGFMAESCGDAALAERYHRRAYEVSQTLADRRAVALCLEGLAGVALVNGEATRCAELLGAAREQRDGTGLPSLAGGGTEWRNRSWNTILLDEFEAARIEAALGERLTSEEIGVAKAAGATRDIEALVGA
jgi:predicted ATPase/DNA-binding SARP family transcriptional activator